MRCEPEPRLKPKRGEAGSETADIFVHNLLACWEFRFLEACRSLTFRSLGAKGLAI